MSVFSTRSAALLIALVMLGLAACSGPVTTSARVGTPEFYWYAAKETYAAGDYVKAADHLDHLIATDNEYTARAVPWSLVLTSGMAAGYMEVADAYVAGARVNKAKGLTFRKKASDYRTIASPLVLRFAQNVDKMSKVPPGGIQLAFGMSKGAANPSPMLSQVASGFQLTQAQEEQLIVQNIQRNVLLAVCRAAGAPNDTARTEEVLGHASALIPRANFENTISQILTLESALYSRDKLDDPEKLEAIKRRAALVLAGAARPAGGVAKSAPAPVEAGVH